MVNLQKEWQRKRKVKMFIMIIKQNFPRKRVTVFQIDRNLEHSRRGKKSPFQEIPLRILEHLKWEDAVSIRVRGGGGKYKWQWSKNGNCIGILNSIGSYTRGVKNRIKNSHVNIRKSTSHELLRRLAENMHQYTRECTENENFWS